MTGDFLQPSGSGEEFVPSNYFNYFTEVEEHFRKARGTGMFLMSPLDWALVESWKNSGVPLEAVLRGIDAAFEKHRARKRKLERINSVAYCAQAVMAEAKLMADAGKSTLQARRTEAPFTLEELHAFLERCALELRSRASEQAEYAEVAEALERLAGDAEVQYQDLEELDRRLTALEDKLAAIARARQTEQDLYEARRELDALLRPYRGKMSAEQLAMLEKQYLDRLLFEKRGLPRLSLFYLR